MGQEEVVARTVSVVILEVLAEIALRMLDGAERVLQMERGDDVGRQDVGAAAELAPGQLVPQLAVAALALQILGAPRQQPADADALTGRWIGARHLVAVPVAVLQIINAR